MKSLKMGFVCLLVLLLQGCLTKSKLAFLPDAENQIITSDGRHFLSSAAGISEIKKGRFGHYLMTAKLPCDEVNGLESYKNQLIAVCADSALLFAKHKLIAVNLNNWPTPDIRTLKTLDGISLPNGIALDKSDMSLYLADFNLFGDGHITRLQLDDSENTLRVTDYQPRFLHKSHGIHAPNGLKLINGDLFVTDFHTLGLSSRLVKINLAHQGYSDHQVLLKRYTLFDDFTHLCGGFLVTDFLNGRLLYLDKRNRLHKTNVQQFQGASSVSLGSEALFDKPTLVVTEKGILKDTLSAIGNQVSLAPISKRLSDSFCG